MNQIPMTKEGFEKLKSDLSVLLREKRPALLEDVKKAQEDNNCAITENSEYIDASASLDRVESKINELELKLRNARVVDLKDLVDDGKIRFGCTVELMNTEDNKISIFKIVGEDESDVKAGKISFLTPLSKEMIGQKAGSFIDCAEKEYEILSVKVIC